MPISEYAEKSTGIAERERAIPHAQARYEECWAALPDLVDRLERRLNPVLRQVGADVPGAGPRSVAGVALAGWIDDRIELVNLVGAHLSEILDRIEL